MYSALCTYYEVFQSGCRKRLISGSVEGARSPASGNFTHVWANKYSAEYSRGTLWRSSKFSQCIVPSSFALCPLNSSLLALPKLSTPTVHLIDPADLCLRSPFLGSNLGMFSQLTWAIKGLTLFASHLSGITERCGLQASDLKTVVAYNFMIFLSDMEGILFFLFVFGDYDMRCAVLNVCCC